MVTDCAIGVSQASGHQCDAKWPIVVSRAEYGAGMKSPVNQRQLDVLRWVADGCPAGRWAEDDYSYKTSAVALQVRGLVKITGRGRTWAATITEAGIYYLGHGAYPAAPHAAPVIAADSGRPAPSKHERPVLKQARELIDRLTNEGTVTIADPNERSRAHYRRILHACRAHHLVPEGQQLLFTGRDSGDIIIKLGLPSSDSETDWNRIRLNTRRITTNFDALRMALQTSSILDQLSEPLRPRAIDFLIDLAEHLRTSDIPLGANLKLKTPKLFIQTGTRRKDISLTEILDEVPHKMTPQEERQQRHEPWKQFPTHDQVPTGRLRLRVVRDGSHEVRSGRNYSSFQPNSDVFCDQKRKPIERQVREIARAIKKGVDDDIAARELEEQRRAETQAARERKEAEDLATWKAVRERARDKALLKLREATFAHAFESWQHAEDLRAFAARLHADASEQGLLESRPRLQQWLQWARDRADQIDPIKNLTALDDDVFNTEPSPNDLRPHMEGWDPKAPHQDYSLRYRASEQPSTNVPQPRPWHPGMAGRPSWWR